MTLAHEHAAFTVAFAGNFDFFEKKSKITPEKIFKRTGALVFVIDAQVCSSRRSGADKIGRAHV